LLSQNGKTLFTRSPVSSSQLNKSTFFRMASTTASQTSEGLGLLSSGVTTAYWYEPKGNSYIPDIYPTLQQDTSADVTVIGAGISGLTAAYLLAAAGKKVVVLEDGLIGSGETGRTTAHIFNALDDRYMEIEKAFSKDASKLVAQSLNQAIEFIDQVVQKEKIDCDFSRLPGYLFVGGDWTQSDLEEEFRAAKDAGIEVEWVNSAPDFESGRAIKFPNQAQFHMNKYITGLAKAATEKGAKIYTRTHVQQINGKEKFVNTLNDKKVTSDHIIQATNVPINDVVTMWTKMKGYRSYVVAAKVPKGSVSHALWWDTTDPYNYLRVQKGEDDSHDVVIIGGQDHTVGTEFNAEERYQNLYKWAKERLPQLGEIVNKWSGQVTEPLDGLPFHGQNPNDAESVQIITGDSGMGMTNGTIGAMVTTDAILGKPNPYSELYSPSRQTITHQFRETVMENIETQLQYLDWLKPADVKDIEDIKPGCGAILRSGLGKVAAYKDENGKVFTCTAVCPHLKAQVQWNDAEKSWDCPAHGSRFNPYGAPLNGPAIRPLEEVKI